MDGPTLPVRPIVRQAARAALATGARSGSSTAISSSASSTTRTSCGSSWPRRRCGHDGPVAPAAPKPAARGRPRRRQSPRSLLPRWAWAGCVSPCGSWSGPSPRARTRWPSASVSTPTCTTSSPSSATRCSPAATPTGHPVHQRIGDMVPRRRVAAADDLDPRLAAPGAARSAGSAWSRSRRGSGSRSPAGGSRCWWPRPSSPSASSATGRTRSTLLIVTFVVGRHRRGDRHAAGGADRHQPAGRRVVTSSWT